MLFLLFVARCSFVVSALLSLFFFFFFSICVVILALWSPSSIAAHFAFCLTSCVVMLAFGHLQQLPVLLSVLLVVIGIGTQGEVVKVL